MKTRYLIALVTAFATLALTCFPMQASELDKRIEASAKDLYVFQTFLKGDDVKIHSVDGVVTLTGTVANEPRSILAQETMANVSGVKSVNNELKIKGDNPAENSDAWIDMRVKTMLLFHRGVSGIGTEVSVKDGTVTLRGEAANKAQKQLTTEYARDVDGVKDVINEMTVAKMPKAESQTVGEKIDDASITSQVKLSLLFHRSTRVLKTQVKTEDGVVTLSGMARNEAEKELVTKLVNDINGVKNVMNKMIIEEPKIK
ncbi:BON domain-containing protein [bacterium]|nr:BON domain-containing protein [candidate division CSSED10-310 bacterium]